ncbi:MAG: hypothetical protein ACXADX_19810, partial [Candidatus Hodarchaeales archaeon]
AESDAAYHVLPPKPPGTSMETDKEPYWIWGLGTPDGDGEMWSDANKGSFYSQVDATDDNSHVFMKVDEGNDAADWVALATMPLQFTTTDASGWSYNKIDVTNAGSSANLRGLRVNARSAASSTIGDLQCIHGNLVLGATTTLAANASLAGLQTWVDITDSTTTATGNVISGLRVILDPNNNDMSAMSGGGESALIYSQTWASTGKIEHGVRVVAGAGSTIKNAFSLGGSGTVDRVLDLSEWGANTEMIFMQGGPADAQSRNMGIYIGDKSTSAAVFAQCPATAALGSLYISTAGKLFIRNNNAGAAADWPEFDSTATV